MCVCVCMWGVSGGRVCVWGVSGVCVRVCVLGVSGVCVCVCECVCVGCEWCRH